ncbi:MAG: T9SS type A sorting domain-containing protein [Chitinophagaceae bacterium]|nr:T9SS type A sorting domain-containing protein [Chitinophagaceae bacterium]
MTGEKIPADLSVLSNPVKDFIIINTNDQSLNNTPGNIINTNGAVVKSFIIKQGSQTIDVKGLPAGVYYLRTSNGSNRIVKQ